MLAPRSGCDSLQSLCSFEHNSELTIGSSLWIPVKTRSLFLFSRGTLKTRIFLFPGVEKPRGIYFKFLIFVVVTKYNFRNSTSTSQLQYNFDEHPQLLFQSVLGAHSSTFRSSELPLNTSFGFGAKFAKNRLRSFGSDIYKISLAVHRLFIWVSGQFSWFLNCTDVLDFVRRRSLCVNVLKIYLAIWTVYLVLF